MKHHIIVKYKPEITSEEKQRLIPEIKTLFEGCLSIDGIHAVELYPNCIDRSNRFDLMIVLDMEESALNAYDACEPHKKWKADYSDLLEKKAIFDCK